MWSSFLFPDQSLGGSVARRTQRRHWLPLVFSTNERPWSGGCSASLLYVFGGSLGSCGLEMWRGGTGGAVMGTGHRLIWLALSGQPRLGIRGDGVLGGVLGELGELPNSQWYRPTGEGWG